MHRMEYKDVSTKSLEIMNLAISCHNLLWPHMVYVSVTCLLTLLRKKGKCENYLYTIKLFLYTNSNLLAVN